MSEGNSRPFNV